MLATRLVLIGGLLSISGSALTQEGSFNSNVEATFGHPISYFPHHSRSQRDALTNVEDGTTIYNTTSGCINWYIQGTWGVFCDDECVPMPSMALAGDDIVWTAGLDSVEATINLNAQSPAEGIGSWIILEGEGGEVADASLPNSAFTGKIGNVYFLRWIVATECAQNTDDLMITLNGPQ